MCTASRRNFKSGVNERLASGLTGTEKAVFRLTTEGYGRGEIARKLGIPHQQVKDTLAVLQHRYAEEQITEAV